MGLWDGRPSTVSHPPTKRGEMISSDFVVSYVAIATPVIGVGFAAESLGLYDVALAFAITIGALTLVAEAITFTGPTRARLGRALPRSAGWLALRGSQRSGLSCTLAYPPGRCAVRAGRRAAVRSVGPIGGPAQPRSGPPPRLG